MSYIILKRDAAVVVPSVRYQGAWEEPLGVWVRKDGAWEELLSGEVLSVRYSETWEDNIS